MKIVLNEKDLQNEKLELSILNAEENGFEVETVNEAGESVAPRPKRPN